MIDIKDMAPHTVCYELDKICAPFYFTYSGLDMQRITALHVYPSSTKADRDKDKLARFIVDEDNPLEYVVTKIILQYSGGTPVA